MPSPGFSHTLFEGAEAGLSATGARLGFKTLLTRSAPSLLVACLTFFWIYAFSAYVSPIYFSAGNDNFWFDADVPRYVCQVVDAGANDHWRNKIHPLFSFLVAPLPNLLHVLGIDMIQAMRIQLSLVAAVGMTFQYLTLRVIGMRMPAALLLVCVLVTSASVLTWFTLVESYAYTFTSFSIVLFMLATAGQRRWGIGHWGGVIGLSFAITISNVVVAGLAAWQALGLRRTLWAGGLALAAVTVLALAQRFFFPLSGIFFLPSALGGESSFMVGLSLERLRELFTLVLYGSFVFPNVDQVAMGAETMLSTQRASFGWNGLPLLCMLLLSFLLLLGAAQLLRRFGSSFKQVMSGKATQEDDLDARLAFPVLGSLTFLFALHSFYGKETFLYTGSFLPLLTVLLAFGLQSAWVRRAGLALPLLAVLVLGNLTHNIPRFTAASTLLQKAALKPLQEQVLKRNTCSFVKRTLTQR
ncbi:MAG: hypothetical protein ACRYF7_06290 [Janthinobacterium lividum]